MTMVRKTDPKSNNKYYISKSKGGYSTEIVIDKKTGSTLPNCVGYAGGAFMEQEGKRIFDVPTCNAESWIVDNTKYAEGREARIGAVIVWAKGKVRYAKDGKGHVGMVIKKYRDGSIDVANSAAGGRRFYITHHNKNYYKAGYSFQGFIYPTKEVKEYEPGRFLMLYTKEKRKTHDLGNNKTGKKAYKNTKVDITEVWTDPTNGRVWGKVEGYWIVICNKDGSTQVTWDC